MTSRSTLLLVVLGIGLGMAKLSPNSSAQVFPSVARGGRPSGQQLDEVRLAAMRKVIQDHARSVNPDDLAQPSAKAKLVYPVKDKTPPSPAKSDKTIDKGKQPANPAPAESTPHSDHAAAPAASGGQAKAAPPAAKLSSQPFNPYPQGREPPAPALPAGYHPNVFVAGPGRLDWTYVVSDSSLDPAPTAMTAGYVSTGQSYELYVPPSYNPRRQFPMIIHVTAGPRSDGWIHWQQTCRFHGVILAGVHNAGNAVPDPTRARIVLDVLNDVRRRFRIDPDRTYISGMSGGAKAATQIAFALPELFGGLTAICGAWNLRAEPMLRQRVSERLSVALLTGTADFNGPELEREFFPILRQHGARSLLRVYSGMGHAYPNPAQMEHVFRWMEMGLPIRRSNAALFPASHLIAPASPNEWSVALVLEAGRRFELPGGMASGLFLLQGVVNRWPALPAAAVAQSLLDEFDKTSPVPWKDLYRNELLSFRYLQARTFDGIVNGPLPPNYPVPRLNLIEIAVWLWNDILSLSPKDGPIAREADARLAQLHKQGG